MIQQAGLVFLASFDELIVQDMVIRKKSLEWCVRWETLQNFTWELKLKDEDIRLSVIFPLYLRFRCD